MINRLVRTLSTQLTPAKSLGYISAELEQPKLISKHRDMNFDKDILKAWRLAAQMMGTQQWQSPGEAVHWLGGVQAQNYQWAKWSIGLRTEGCNEDQVDGAIRNHQIVRTWMFRGTLHFVAADDLSWLTNLLAPGIIKRNARRYRELGLDDAVFVKSQKMIQHALEAKSPLTRSEIKTHFKKEGVPTQGQQVPHLLQRAALDGLICQGPQRKDEPTYVLVSEWINPHQSLDQEEALALLTERYFSGHGPATEQDFAWWSGLTAKEVRQGLEAAPQVVPLVADDIQYWAIDEPPSRVATESAYLLPPFDEYLLGYKGRSLVLDSTYTKRVNVGGGMLKPTVMVTGNILGIWSYQMKKQKLVLSIHPFRELDSHERGLVERAASQLSSFKSIPLDLSFAQIHVA